MIRIAITAALLLGFVHQAASRDALAAPRLKPSVAVTSDVVLIGDLVEDAGVAANIAVFRAPDLGETGAVDISRIAAALGPHHILQLDTGGIREVVVTRLSRAIAVAEIEQRLLRAFAGRYGFGEARNLAVVPDRPLRALHVEATTTAELAIARLNVDPHSGRFDVSFELPGSAAARRLPLRITGVVSETVEAVVLIRAVERGHVIGAADVAVERRRRSEALNGAIPADQAIGLAAKRPMRAGELLRTADLAKAEVVHRNQAVTIVYQVPGILLTVRGKALEAGAVGDVINVTNVQSNRTVQATIDGPGRVVIAAPVPPVTTVASIEPLAPPAPVAPPAVAAPLPATPIAPPTAIAPLVRATPVAPTLPLPAVSVLPPTL